MAHGTARLVAVALVFAGLVYAAEPLGAAEQRHVELALTAVAIAALLQLMVTVDAAWLLTAGLAASMFAGHWEEMGVHTPVAPHRALLAAGVLAVIFRAPPVRDRPRLEFGAAHLALAAAFGYVVVSAIFNETLENIDGQVAMIDTFGLVPFVLFTVSPVAFATQRQRMILLGGLVAVGAYLAVTAVIEQLGLYDLVVPAYIGDSEVGIHFGRARGPFAEAAANGVALYICGAAALVGLALWRGRVPRLWARFVAALAPVAILLTVTRGAWLAAIIATLLTMASTATLRRHMPKVAVAGTLGVLLAFALIPGVADEARDRQNDKTPIYERQNTTAAGLRMLSDEPFFGHGWFFDKAELLPYFRLDPNIPLVGARAGLHNVYLHYAVSLGIVGLGLWALAVAAVFGRALAVRVPPELVPWQIGLRAALAAWLVLGLFNPASYSFMTAAVWTWAGVIWPAWRQAGEPGAEPEPALGLNTRLSDDPAARALGR